jgi:alpha-beta hydrolase superfamily lysophospholipase
VPIVRCHAVEVTGAPGKCGCVNGQRVKTGADVWPLRRGRLVRISEVPNRPPLSPHSLKTPERAREHFYSAGVPESEVVRYAAALGEEYGGRLTLDLWVLNLPKPERVSTPLLVLGAGLDACVTEAETQTTARAYGTEAQIFPNMGHNMMLEPGWQAVAERIDGWLTDRGL